MRISHDETEPKVGTQDIVFTSGQWPMIIFIPLLMNNWYCIDLLVLSIFIAMPCSLFIIFTTKFYFDKILIITNFSCMPQKYWAVLDSHIVYSPVGVFTALMIYVTRFCPSENERQREYLKASCTLLQRICRRNEKVGKDRKDCVSTNNILL